MRAASVSPPHPQEGQDAIAQGRFPAGVMGHQEGFRADRPRPGCQKEPSGSVSRRTVGWGWGRGTSRPGGQGEAKTISGWEWWEQR